MATTKSQVGWARTQIRIPPDLHQQAHELAQQEGRSFNAQLLAFIREGIRSRTIGGAQNAQTV